MRFKRILCSKRVRVVFLVVLLALALTLAFAGVRRHSEAAREADLKQVFAAMEQYAEVSAGNYYPLRSAEEGVLLPDFDEWERLAPDKGAFERARRTLTRERERPLCYLGYAFNKDTFGLTILDRLEKDPRSFRGGGPIGEEEDWSVDVHSPEADELHALRKGVERNFVWDFVFYGLTPREGELEDRVPILWEMPQGESDEVLVLNLSGYVYKRKYPGEFPLSPLFVNRVRGLMGLPRDPGYRDDAPIIPILRRIMSEWDHQQTGWAWSIEHFDIDPSVTAGRHAGYRITVPEARMVLFPGEGEPPDFDAASFFHVRNAIPWVQNYADPGQYVGSGSGYHWYGSVTYEMQLLLRDKFELKGGDSLYAVAVAHCRRHHQALGLSDGRSRSELESAERIEAPTDLIDYVQAYLVLRSDEGRPVDVSIVDAGRVLEAAFWEGYGNFRCPDAEVQEEAARRLVKASESDPEGAATVAMLYALRYRWRSPRKEVTEEGLKLLRELPRDAVVQVVERMASRIQQQEEAEACRKILGELERAPGDHATQNE